MKDPNLPFDQAQAFVNDPNPVTILIYTLGFLIAIIWNFYAYYKLVTLEHKKEEMQIKRELRSQGLLDDDEE